MSDLTINTADVLGELRDRLTHAESVVKRLARDSAVAKSSFAVTERHRLEGKAEGLRLALGYVNEAISDEVETERG